MDNLLVQAAQYGFGGLMVAVLIYVLWRQNETSVARTTALEAKLDKQNEWQMQFIENNTKATLGATASWDSLTKTVQELVRANNDLDRTVRERVAK